MGRVVKTVAIGAALAVAAVATAGAALAPAGALLFGLSATTVLGGLAAASLIGAQYLMRPTSQGAGFSLPSFQSAPSGPPPTPLRRTIKQSDSPRCFIFGRTRTSGAYFFYESDTSNAQSQGKHLYQGIYICDGPIGGFDAFICDDEVFPYGSTGVNRTSYASDGSDNVFIPAKVDSTGQYIQDPAAAGYNSIKWKQSTVQYTSTPTYGTVYINGKWQLVPTGSTTTSSTLPIKDCSGIAFEPVNATVSGYNSYILNTLMSNYSGAATSGVWSTSHLGKGVTCVYTWASTIQYGNASRIKYFPNGWPEWSFMVRGAVMYDPRVASMTKLQNGVWSLYNTTWAHSDNPALVAAHFISWLIAEKMTAISGVNWDSIIKAANDCDALVTSTKAVKGSSFASGVTYKERFATISGVYYFNTPPREFLSNIMAACDGTYWIDGNGLFNMWIGQWETPEVTFYEDDIGGFTEDFVEASTESINELHYTYIEPKNNYQRMEGPVYTDATSQGQVGKRISTINFDLVPSVNQAYRLAARFAKRINGKKKLNITLGPRAMLAVRQRVVGVYAPNFGINNGTSPIVFRIESLQPSGTLAVWSATLREITQDVFSDPAAPDDPCKSIKLVTYTGLPKPQYAWKASYSAVGGWQATINADYNYNMPSSPIPSIVELATVFDDTVEIEAEYSTNGSTFSPMTVYISRMQVISPTLSTSISTIYMRYRFVSLSGATSDWSPIMMVNKP